MNVGPRRPAAARTSHETKRNLKIYLTAHFRPQAATVPHCTKRALREGARDNVMQHG
jgi:hypothetical protein